MKKIFIFIIVFSIETTIAQNHTSILDQTQRLTEFLNKKNAWGDSLLLGYTKSNSYPIYAYKFNKNSNKKALIIAGVHGSEFYGVDVAYNILNKLRHAKERNLKWNLIIIPELFIENVTESRKSIFADYKNEDSLIAIINKARKTCENCTDPNRQMPFIKNLYIPNNANAYVGKIEIENQYLLQLVQNFNPERIASLHCKNEFSNKQIGIYADPRTDSNQIALGFTKDSILTLKMAKKVKSLNGTILGNFKNNQLTAIYPSDSQPAKIGKRQYRSYEDSLKAGVSFGTWASTEIYDNNTLIKVASKMITIELPQYYSFFKGDTKILDIDKLYVNTNAYTKSILEDFLE